MVYMVDTSNHKSLKLVPVLVRSFIPRKGVETKVIDHIYNGCTGHVQAIKQNYCLLCG
jgi:hypothetical protein